MSQGNGFQPRQLDQINTSEGQPLCATSAPDWFIRPDSRYGAPFAPKRQGNKVKFFTTGDAYFKDVAAAIVNAKKSIFITGWQINYEVRLDGDKRLWDCLAEALRKNDKPDIYIMPWLSPKAGVDTGDFETMLAAFILNAGLEERKVWCMPAIQQSDMDNLGTFFSHHQKLVVIDNEIAYTGGIDLAYGRRDDNNFRLGADGRTARELYNPCIPPIKTIPSHQQYPFMTTFELLGAALMEGDELSKAQRWLWGNLDNDQVNALRQKKQSAVDWLADKAKYGLRMIAAGTAYATGGAMDFANFIQEQFTPEGIEKWKQTLTGWHQTLGDIIAAIHDEANTLERTDSTLSRWLEETRALQHDVGNWLARAEQQQHLSPEETAKLHENADRLYARISGWLERAQQQLPQIRPHTQAISARLQQAVSRLEQQLSDWHKAYAPELDRLQQELVTWAQKIKQNAQRITAEQLDQGSALLSAWSEQTGAGSFVAWLRDTPTPVITAQAMEEFDAIATPFLLYVHSVLDRMSDAQEMEPYSYLADPNTLLIPPGGAMLDPERQPRMPWHDVQVRVEGTAVEDMSRNFVDRWNSIQKRYEGTVQSMPSLLADTLEFIDTNMAPVPFKPHYLPVPQPVPPQGNLYAQVLRSAPQRLLRQERAAPHAANTSANACQANCMQAMLQAISGAQQFIYIENQFFQSDFGEVDYATPPKDESQTANATDVEEKPYIDGPMQSLIEFEQIPGYERYAARLGLEGEFEDNYDRLDKINYYALAEMIRTHEADDFVAALITVINNRRLIRTINAIQSPQDKIQNQLCDALAERIEAAIEMGEDFHVYMVLPVNPEGPLNMFTLMNQVHLTMQSLSLGTLSLVKRIQRAMAMKAQMDSGIPEDIASENIDKFQLRGEAWLVYEQENWQRYLTLLNLRTWESLNGLPVTEQIYVHSKLLIADDRVAILGSANINDRSQIGNRDSELAVVISGGEPQQSMLNGCSPQPICPEVQKLRIDLWRKLFALDVTHEQVGVAAATQLEPMLEQPAAPATWQAIQSQASDNQAAFEEAFTHIPHNHASIWPTWPESHNGSMPFESAFWQQTTPSTPPKKVAGFITSLPLYWTRRENNNSGFNLSVLAQHHEQEQENLYATSYTASGAST